MGKRSSFARFERDLYPTPREPVLDLAPHLYDVWGFAEPCVGDGALVGHLTGLGHRCDYACDVEPVGDALEYAHRRDALTLSREDLNRASHIITNPPWPQPKLRGEPTLTLIRHLATLRPTWLLLPADFMHNVYAAEVLAYCCMVVSVGRVKWIPDSDNGGKDNAAWYLFDRRRLGEGTVFHPRGGRKPVFAAEIEAVIGHRDEAELEKLI